jgi:Tfp pilus assembly protein PilO
MLAKSIVVTVLLISTATAVLFSKNYGASIATANSISSQISEDRQELQSVTKQTENTDREINELMDRILTADKAIDAANDDLPAEIDPNDVVENILRLGKENGLTVIPLVTKEWKEVNLEKLSYLTLQISAQVQGSMDQLIPFLRDVQSLYYPVVIVKHVSVAGTDSEEVPNKIQANIDLTVYLRNY